MLPLHRQTGLGGEVYSSQTLSLKRCGFLPTLRYRFQQVPSRPSGSCLGGTKVKNSHGISREDILPTPKPRTPICFKSSFSFHSWKCRPLHPPRTSSTRAWTKNRRRAISISHNGVRYFFHADAVCSNCADLNLNNISRLQQVTNL